MEPLSNWELTAHLAAHEFEDTVHKNVIGTILGTLYSWSDNELVEPEEIDNLLAAIITTYVRSYDNFFSPDDPEDVIAAFRKLLDGES